MVNLQQDRLDSVFGALSDGTRRAILARLSQGPANVTEIAKPFKSSLPAITKHLNVLEASGLIQRKNQGRMRVCELNPATLSIAATWLDRYTTFWEERLDSLERLLNSEEEK